MFPRGEAHRGPAGGSGGATRPLVPAQTAGRAVARSAGDNDDRRLRGVAANWLEANRQRDRADFEKQVALREAYRAHIVATTAALESHDVPEAARQLDAAPEFLRGWEWRHLHSRLDDSSVVFRPSAEEGGPDLYPSPRGIWVCWNMPSACA